MAKSSQNGNYKHDKDIKATWLVNTAYRQGAGNRQKHSLEKNEKIRNIRIKG